jgi:hypothetical protein
VTQFMEVTSAIISPDQHRRWAAIALVAGALERRVWVRTSLGVAFPNLYTLLVAPPGVGKYVIETARELWLQTTEPGTKAPAFHVAPDSMSKASLMDEIKASRSTRIVPTGPPLVYHSLLIAAEEFEMLLPDYDKEYIGALNSIFNNKSFHRETRRTGSVRELKIEFPQLNILAGVQPSYFISTFPEEAWSTGFARRIIMVYAAEAPFRELWGQVPDQAVGHEDLLHRLGQMSQLYGQAKWTEPAAAALADWHRQGGPPAPGHSKLAHYVRSRTLHATKLALVSAVSRSGGLVIELADVERAIEWLVGAERLMPDIFREMAGKSDSQVIEELHYFAMQVYNREKQKPIHRSLLVHFLSQRTPSEKIDRILAVAEQANILTRLAGTTDMFKPVPRHQHGVE